MPLTAEIRSVHDAFAIGREIWLGFPRGFFIVNLALLRARLNLHSPEAACSIDVPTIGNENQVCSVRRPCWTNLVIEFAVVETRQIAAGLTGEPPHVGQLAAAEIGNKNMKALVIRSGDKGQVLAI